MMSNTMNTMMRSILTILILATTAQRSVAQDTTVWRDSLDAYWSLMDAEFADSITSPLTASDRAHFKHLGRFTPDTTYRVHAKFTPAENAEPFAMRTSTTRAPMYKPYGTLRFMLNGKEWSLVVYESVPPHPGHENEMFLPFTDLSNGKETHGSGRYLDLMAPLDPLVTLDFNKAYNPYCAYNDRYSCPIPPKENHMATDVRAGVLEFHE